MDSGESLKMAIEAPLGKHKKNMLKIWLIVCVGAAVYCAYDGFFNDKFIEKHTDANGPDSTLAFNQKSPAFFIGAAILLGAYLFAIKNKKVIIDENNLIVGKKSIACDSIKKIDKTYFNSKGYFIIAYKDENGVEVNRKLSDRTYDNLAAILDELVAKIS